MLIISYMVVDFIIIEFSKVYFVISW